jgi:hypothetical protein
MHMMPKDLSALADAATGAADRASRSIEEALDFVNASNRRIAAMEADAMKSQQQKIEDLTGRVIRLEAQLELLTSAALIKKLKDS